MELLKQYSHASAELEPLRAGGTAFLDPTNSGGRVRAAFFTYTFTEVSRLADAAIAVALLPAGCRVLSTEVIHSEGGVGAFFTISAVIAEGITLTLAEVDNADAGTTRAMYDGAAGDKILSLTGENLLPVQLFVDGTTALNSTVRGVIYYVDNS